MQVVDEKPIETIHLYVVREDDRKPPSLLPIFVSILVLFSLIAAGMLFPYHPYYEHKTLRIPARFLPLQTFTAAEPIIPTGAKTYIATTAHGVLTVYNGSVITQEIPRGMILTSTNGVEVVVEDAVTVSAGNPPYYGIASVSAHTVVSGVRGNIAAYAIDNIYGTSLYIRNLVAFHGGKNSYSVKVATAQDKEAAIEAARSSLTAQVVRRHTFLAKPCNESAQEKKAILSISWQCQFVTYSVPSYMHVTQVKLVGKNLYVDVVFVPRPRIIQFK